MIDVVVEFILKLIIFQKLSFFLYSLDTTFYMTLSYFATFKIFPTQPGRSLTLRSKRVKTKKEKSQNTLNSVQKIKLQNAYTKFIDSKM